MASAELAAPLALNRCARVQRLCEGDTLVGVAVAAPVRGEGLRTTTFPVAEEPSLCEAILAIAEARAPLALAPALVQRLLAAGLVTPSASRPRRVRFANLLPAVLPALPAEATAHRRARRTDGPLVTNPTLRLARPEPGEPAVFAAGLPWRAWLEEPGLPLPVPFWLDDAQATALAASPAALAPETRALLLETGVLEPEGYRAREAAARDSELLRAQGEMEAQRYTVLRNLVHPFLLLALQQFYRALLAEGHLPFGDNQSRRYYAHGEPVARWLHEAMTPVVARALVAPIKPSYAYVASYVAGAVLERHQDRDQCEYTLSLTIDATPDGSLAQAWPLWVETAPRRAQAVRLAPGDGLLFKGRELPHFRERLPDGCTSTSVFLHFVHQDFAGSLA